MNFSGRIHHIKDIDQNHYLGNYYLGNQSNGESLSGESLELCQLLHDKFPGFHAIEVTIPCVPYCMHITSDGLILTDFRQFKFPNKSLTLKQFHLVEF